MMEDTALTDLFGDEVQAAKKAAKLTEYQQDRLTESLRVLLDSPHGKEFLWWLLGQTHVFQSSFTGNSATYFLEGERSIGLKVYNQLMLAEPSALQELIDYRRKREE